MSRKIYIPKYLRDWSRDKCLQELAELDKLAEDDMKWHHNLEHCALMTDDELHQAIRERLPRGGAWVWKLNRKAKFALLTELIGRKYLPALACNFLEADYPGFLEKLK